MTSSKIAEGSVGTAHLADSFQLPEGSVSSSHLAESFQLPAGSVTADKLADGFQLPSTVIAGGALTAATVFDGDVAGEANSLTIKPGVVTGDKIAQGSITMGHLAKDVKLGADAIAGARSPKPQSLAAI